MAASYPGAIKSFSAVVNGVTKLVAALFNSPYDEITAIETALGANLSNVRLGTVTDVSAAGAHDDETAATDGFVEGWGVLADSSAGWCKWYTSSDASVHTGQFSNPADWSPAGSYPIFMSVKKGDKWKVTTSNCTVTLYWRVSGS